MAFLDYSGLQHFKDTENAQVAPVESEATASQSYEIGEYFWHEGNFCKAKISISIGDTLTQNTNYTVVTVGDELTQKANIDGSYEEMTVGSARQLVSTVGVEDNAPYVFRTAGGTADIGDREEDKIIGGSFVWNQRVTNGDFKNNSTTGWTGSTYVGLTASGGKLTVRETGSSNRSYTASTDVGAIVGHKYLVQAYLRRDVASASTGNTTGFYYSIGGASAKKLTLNLNQVAKISTIFEATTTGALYFQKQTGNFGAGTNLFTVWDVAAYDLTAMFGESIANAIQALETSEAGAGVAVFKKLFPKDFYDYSAGSIESVQVSSHKMVGFNAYNHTNGTAKVVGNNQYQITGSYTALTLDGETVEPDEDGYFTPSASGVLTVTGGDSTTTCVHLVWDGEKDGEWEEYTVHDYPLDEDLVLRGLPKLNESNDFYYDGDIYESDGTVTRKYDIVDLGTLSWTKMSYTDKSVFSATLSGPKTRASNVYDNAICPKYLPSTSRAATSLEDLRFMLRGDISAIYIRDDSYEDADTFTPAMNGIKLLYELEVPISEEANPYTNPQIVDDFGTEEYVDYPYSEGLRTVEIPTGHETWYQNNLRAKLEMSPNSPEGDGDYIVRQVDGMNEYVPISSIGNLMYLSYEVLT